MIGARAVGAAPAFRPHSRTSAGCLSVARGGQISSPGGRCCDAPTGRLEGKKQFIEDMRTADGSVIGVGVAIGVALSVALGSFAWIGLGIGITIAMSAGRQAAARRDGAAAGGDRPSGDGGGAGPH
ncbi:hypothetical protein GCM10027055_30010 [Janibacter alkaliphilus]